jgi:LPS-assembly protein
VMRKARTPHEGCGLSRSRLRRISTAGIAHSLARALLSLITVSLIALSPAHAQDPSVTFSGYGAKAASSFGNANSQNAMFGPVKKSLDKTQPLYLQGDQLVYDTSGSKVIARGNVEIYYNDNILTADEVIYDQGASTLTANGNVTLKEPQGNVIHADSYTLTDDFRDGFVQSLSMVTKDQTRIAAERATRREGNVTEFTNGKFTPCKSDGSTPPLWCLSASKIIHDKDAATVTYQDAYFELFGQPIMYLPYFQHPDPTVKRQSGFLVPLLGQSSTLGYMTEIPYFYNIAPNADFTFSPRYLSEMGVLWQGEWRHRLANGQYSVKVDAIDQNVSDLDPSIANRDQLGGWRGSLETKGQFALSSWWKFGWDVTLESDDTFRRFYKLDSILLTDRVNQIYLTGQSDRNYFSAKLYQFGGLLLSDTPQAESYTHPVIDYNYVFADPVLGGELKWDTNILSFTRNNGAQTLNDGTILQSHDQNVNRLVTELKWRRKLTDGFGITYTPFGNLRGDVYQFDNYNNPETVIVDPATGQVTASLTPNDTTVRGLAEGGVTVSYPWVATTANASHIIEPIGQIVARQDAVSQRALPNEDARSLVFDDTNLFETSKYSGYDRIETGTRVNAGLQYTFQLNSGGYARFLAGESYHLTGDNVYAAPGLDDTGKPLYSPSSGLQTARSDYVLGAYLAPTDYFRVIAQSRFDRDTLSLQHEDAAIVLNYGPLMLSGAYSLTAPDPALSVPVAQQDVSATGLLRLTDYWSVGGGIRYDIDNQQMLSDTILVKYSDECFVLTATYEHDYYNSAVLTEDQTVMFRFEFKHLGEYHYKTAIGGDQPVQN